MTILIPAATVARMTDKPRSKRTDPTPEQTEMAFHRWQDSVLLRWRFGSRPARRER